MNFNPIHRLQHGTICYDLRASLHVTTKGRLETLKILNLTITHRIPYTGTHLHPGLQLRQLILPHQDSAYHRASILPLPNLWF